MHLAVHACNQCERYDVSCAQVSNRALLDVMRFPCHFASDVIVHDGDASVGGWCRCDVGCDMEVMWM